MEEIGNEADAELCGKPESVCWGHFEAFAPFLLSKVFGD